MTWSALYGIEHLPIYSNFPNCVSALLNTWETSPILHIFENLESYAVARVNQQNADLENALQNVPKNANVI